MIINLNTKPNYGRRGEKLEMTLDTSPPPPSTGKGAVGDGWAHKSRAPRRWQRLCHSSTPTSQLQSSDCAREHIPGEILPLSAWKHNHTHARTFATRQTRLPLTFIWLCIFISCIHAGVFVDTEFLEVKLCFFPPQFSQSIGHVSGFMANRKLWNCPHEDIPSLYICKSIFPIPCQASPFCHLAFITIYLTFLFSAEILLYIFHVNNQKPSQ